MSAGALPRAWLALALLVTSSGHVLAVQPDEVLPDARLEARARDISSGLRCLVCQNQSIDDSDAPLARDLRLIVRERLKAGDDDKQVQAYVVGRYGEYVLLRPVLALHTLLLWLTPLAALGLGVFGIWRLSRRRADGEAALTAREEAEIAALTRRD
ncbi:cytochrome c-type biogenesis protein [Methylobacterium sp. 77]|uniref:cytochrome c-type biogenesis protein n=1 Tax=Methylobacterium sp. 77 TaxID=1101192 RepID=UPI00047BA9F1|nr:cytochrome c-type biogenesis protein [Methylobacterium sp. 77]